MHIVNPIAPHRGHLLTLEVDGEQRTEVVDGLTTYHHQLEAFRDAVLHGGPRLTGGRDAIANMELIDAAYLAAGFPLRGQPI